MQLVMGKWGHQRKAKPMQIEFFPNSAGQGGAPTILMVEANTPLVKGTPFIELIPESKDDVLRLLSQSHQVHHSYADYDRIQEAKQAAGVL